MGKESDFEKKMRPTNSPCGETTNERHTTPNGTRLNLNVWVIGPKNNDAPHHFWCEASR